MDKFNLGGIGERLKPVGERLRSGGERLKPVGERLRSGGAEMGRLVSGKMKEILQGPSQEAKMVDEATSDKLEQPNWGLNLKICALVNSEEFDGSQVVRAIKRKIAGRSVVSISLSLELLEVCAMNCEKVFSEIASEKLLDDMVRLIENPQMEYAIRKKALQLINAWGQSDDLAYLPVFKQTCIALKEKNMAEMIEQVERSALHVSTSETNFVEDAAPSVPEWYGGGLTEEEKKEALVLARNSVDLLSSILNSSEVKENPNQGDDLTMSILEKCREVKPVIKRIIESTADDEAMLFEAINLHDEIDVVLSKFGEITLDHPPKTDVEPISNEPKATHGEDNNPPEEKGHPAPPDYTDSAGGSSAKSHVN
ncbi:hypothetical protein LUZ61_018621 [Rhynchospora tenuis]|uniref:VHS domain-containing protein n=1 Tax=Rhynchospora tenuis TaxID=198213 RepID=A0AAD5Z9N4_9POAL|nr:hypothetical protein LUZ61_018621 [Rhynchospora tenuis]